VLVSYLADVRTLGKSQSLETNSNIFGRTVNPFNRLLTPGGSSGGESALLAMHGSVIGVGERSRIFWFCAPVDFENRN
jgi:hypothetical protein